MRLSCNTAIALPLNQHVCMSSCPPYSYSMMLLSFDTTSALLLNESVCITPVLHIHIPWCIYHATRHCFYPSMSVYASVLSSIFILNDAVIMQHDISPTPKWVWTSILSSIFPCNVAVIMQHDIGSTPQWVFATELSSIFVFHDALSWNTAFELPLNECMCIGPVIHIPIQRCGYHAT